MPDGDMQRTWRQIPSCGIEGKDERQSSQTEILEIPFKPEGGRKKNKKKLFYSEGSQTLEQLTQIGCQ